MKRISSIIFLIFITKISYSQNEFGDIRAILDHYPSYSSYIENPSPCDTLCKNDLARALSDYKNGNLTFCKPIWFLNGFFRFDKEIETVCHSLGLNYKVLPESDVVVECQTQGCYGAFMDKMIKNKFGNDINKRIYLAADSLFVQKIRKSQIFVSEYECDKKPEIIGNKCVDNTITVNVSSSEVLLLSPESKVPNVTYAVKVDSAGKTISYNVMESENMEYILTSYRKKLFDIAENKLSQLYWMPGQILNCNINCITRLTFQFKN